MTNLRSSRITSFALALTAFLTLSATGFGQAFQDLGTVGVGSSSTSSVTLTFSAGQLSAAPVVSTQYGQEFTPGAVTCNPGFTSCTVPVTFAPEYAGLRHDAVIATQSSGVVVGTRVLHGTGSGSQLVVVPGVFGASSCCQGFQLSWVADQYGNSYYVSFGTSQVVTQAAGTGVPSVIAGTGASGYAGDGGPAIDAQLQSPSALALDGLGNLFISDTDTIRKVDLKTGVITTVAGTYNQSGSTGDGGLALAALINDPGLIAADWQGNIFLVELNSNYPNPTSTVREISAATGNIRSVVTNTAGLFGGITADNFGNLYVADETTDLIYKIVVATSTATVYAGTGTAGESGDGGPALSAQFFRPNALVTDMSGNLYVVDGTLVRRIDAATGIIRTVVGNVSDVCCNNAATGAPATSANLSFVGNLAVLANGELLVLGNGTVVPVVSANGALSFGSVAPGASSTESLLLTNIGNAPSTLGQIGFEGLQAFEFSQTNTCGSQIAAGSSCAVTVTFAGKELAPANATLSIPASPQRSTVALTAQVVGQPQLSVSASSLNFSGSEQSSITQSLALTNTGNAVLNILDFALTSSTSAFSISGCYTSISPGQTCNANVTFLAPQPSVYSNSIVINSNAAPVTVSLTGTATASGIISVPGFISLLVQTPGVVTPPTALPVTNIGHAPLTITGLSFTGSSAANMSQTNDCTTALAASQSCIIWLSFTPAANEQNFLNANLSISSNAPGSPRSLSLSAELNTPFVQPTLNVDFPAANATLSGTVTLTGWVVSSYTSLYSVTVTVDGQFIGFGPVTGSRPDVCAVYPNSLDCPNPGWGLPFDTTKLGDGTHQLAVTVTSFNNFAQTNIVPPVFVTVPFKIANSGNPGTIQINIDQPGSSAAASSGTVLFSGWAFDKVSTIQSVSLVVDNVPFATTSYGVYRADVCAIYPGRPGCPNVGWSASVDTTTIPDGVHTLAVTATTSDGRNRTITNTFTVANAAASPVHMNIDAPALNAPSARGDLVASGWAFDADAKIASIAASVDGVSLESAMLLPRPDVCVAYANPAGCPNLGWSAFINTASFPDGIHTLQVIATSSDGHHRAQTRQFTTANAGDLAADTANGWIDTPNSNSGPLSGLITVSGWAVDEFAPMSSITVSVDSQSTATPVNFFVTRQDVCVLLPNYVGCPNVGWSTNIDTTTLADGAHVLTMLATAQDGHRVTRTATFTTSNASLDAAAGIIVSIDTPTANATVSGAMTMSGWAVTSSVFFNQISILVDGVPFGTADYGIYRADVCAVYPRAFNCPNVGWTYTLDTRLLPNGTHVITIQAGSYYGVADAVARAVTVTVNNGSASMHASIDAPAANAQLSGTFQFAGWAFDDASNLRSIQATVDGTSVGQAFYGAYRPDVCAVFPGRPGCPSVGWSVFVDTTEFADGPHVFAITATSAAGDEVTFSKSFVSSNQ